MAEGSITPDEYMQKLELRYRTHLQCGSYGKCVWAGTGRLMRLLCSTRMRREREEEFEKREERGKYEKLQERQKLNQIAYL